MIRLHNKVKDTYTYFGSNTPFIFDMCGRVFIGSSRQGDGQLVFQRCGKNVMLEIKQVDVKGEVIWIPIEPTE